MSYRLSARENGRVFVRASAFFVGSDLVATAFHLVGNRVEGTWFRDTMSSIEYTLELPGGAVLPLEPVMANLASDMAILRVDARAAADHTPLDGMVIRDTLGIPLDRHAWSTVVNTDIPGRARIIRGRITRVRPREGARALELSLDGCLDDGRADRVADPGPEPSSSRSLSIPPAANPLIGSPVVVNGRPVGMLTRFSLDGERAWAATVDDICLLVRTIEMGIADELTEILTTYGSTEKLEEIIEWLDWSTAIDKKNLASMARAITRDAFQLGPKAALRLLEVAGRQLPRVPEIDDVKRRAGELLRLAHMAIPAAAVPQWSLVEELSSTPDRDTYLARNIDRPAVKGIVQIFHHHTTALGSLSGLRARMQTLTEISSPHIVHIQDYGVLDDGRPYIVTERLDGQPLSSYLGAQGPLPLRQIVRICEQLATALSAVHGRGMVHGHLNPDCIFVCRDSSGRDSVKLLGFEFTDPSQCDRSAYTSPEQIHCAGIDQRSDIFSLAAILYHCVTGVVPDATVLSNPANGSADRAGSSAETSTASAPEPVWQVLRKGLHSDRQVRPANVTAFYYEVAAAVPSNDLSESTSQSAVFGTATLARTSYLTTMIDAPLWRGRVNRPDRLRFMLSHGPRHDRQSGREKDLILRPDKSEYLIGRADQADLRIDVSRGISRRAAVVSVREDRVYLKRHPESRSSVRVGTTVLERNEERPLYHGQVVVIGSISGVFRDGRYVPPLVPSSTIDTLTGLLARDGLIWEMALADRIKKHRMLALFTAVDPDGQPELVACAIALALHRIARTWPVARVQDHVGALVDDHDQLTEILPALKSACQQPSILVGYYRFPTTMRHAGAPLEEATAALTRVAMTVDPADVTDLADHVIPIRTVDEFLGQVAPLVASGGDIVLMALQDRDRLVQMGEHIPAAVEHELMQIASRILGNNAVFARPVSGVVAWASATASDDMARDIAAEWHSRGPIRGEIIEVERAITISTVRSTEKDALLRRADDLAHASSLEAGLDGLPYPIAVHIRRFLAEGVTPIHRAQYLTDIVLATWKFLAVILASLALGSRSRTSMAQQALCCTGDGITGWVEVASAFAAQLGNKPGRVGDLCRALFELDHQPREVLAAAARLATDGALLSTGQSLSGREIDDLEDAVSQMLAALRPLRGWTLVGVENAKAVDLAGDSQQVHYFDYTGAHDQGIPRKLILTMDRRFGRRVYWTRFTEGIVVPLEPFIRRLHCSICGQDKLFWSSQLITQPGIHEYCGIASGHSLEESVNPRQLPVGLSETPNRGTQSNESQQQRSRSSA